MSEGQIDKPNQWSTITEYSKTIITLSSGLLIGSIALVQWLVVKPLYNVMVWIFVAWIFLSLSVICGLLTAALCINYLRNNTKEKFCIFCANASFFAFFLAISFFLLGGGLKIFQDDPLTCSEAVVFGEKEIKEIYKSISSLELDSVEYNSSKDEFRVIFLEKGTTNKFTTLVDSKTSMVKSVTK